MGRLRVGLASASQTPIWDTAIQGLTVLSLPTYWMPVKCHYVGSSDLFIVRLFFCNFFPLSFEIGSLSFSFFLFFVFLLFPFVFFCFPLFSFVSFCFLLFSFHFSIFFFWGERLVINMTTAPDHQRRI